MGSESGFGNASSATRQKSDGVGERGQKVSNARYYHLANVDEEVIKPDCDIPSSELVEILNSIANRNARLLLTIYSLTRGGSCGALAEEGVLLARSYIERANYYTYLKGLSLMGFIGVSSRKHSVVVEAEDEDDIWITGGIMWIESRGKVGNHPYQEEANVESDKVPKRRKNSYRSEVPRWVRKVLVYPKGEA